MNKNGIGPQGLGNKNHNGFWIGSPAKQKSKYSDATKKFEGFNQAKDTVTINRSNNPAGLMQEIDAESMRSFKGNAPKQTKFTKDAEGNYSSYNLRDKPSPAKKACWSGYERTPGTKKGAQGSCRKK
jgi:hypothetical protein